MVHLLSWTVPLVALLARWSLPASIVREDSQWCLCVISWHQYHLFEWDGLLEPELVSRHSGKEGGGSFSSTCARLKHVIELGFQMGLCPWICCVAGFLPLLPHHPLSHLMHRKQLLQPVQNADSRVQQSHWSQLEPLLVAPSPWSTCTPCLRHQFSHFSHSPNDMPSFLMPFLGLFLRNCYGIVYFKFLFNYWQNPFMRIPVWILPPV